MVRSDIIARWIIALRSTESMVFVHGMDQFINGEIRSQIEAQNSFFMLVPDPPGDLPCLTRHVYRRGKDNEYDELLYPW